MLSRRRTEKLKRMADEIQAEGGQTVYKELDVTKEVENKAIVELAKATFGSVDAIFLNVGLMPDTSLSALKTKE